MRLQRVCICVKGGKDAYSISQHNTPSDIKDAHQRVK